MKTTTILVAALASAVAFTTTTQAQIPFAPDSHVSLSLPLQASEDLTYGAVTESPGGEPSASELNRQLANPVSSVWSIANQFNNFELNNGQWNNNWNFQPVMPVSLTKDWNLITRPVMPWYDIVPHETSPGNFERATGLGDLALVELLSPAHSGNWILGAGPTAIFPTATSPFTGQGKWQLGPSFVAGYLTKEYFIGVFPQQWWSIGGEHCRHDTNQMNLQPIVTVFFGEGWSLGSRAISLRTGTRRLRTSDGARRARLGQGGEIWEVAGQASARGAVHAGAPRISSRSGTCRSLSFLSFLSLSRAPCFSNAER